MAEYAPVDKARFLDTIREYNAAVQRDIPYNPTVKDGRTTKGLAINKTNWAMPIEKPPFEAYCTTCGVTFTFGGLRIDTDRRGLGTAPRPIPGLYAAGELVGGLFYFNYPGGTGLVSGSVFGKIAGSTAGEQLGRNAGSRAKNALNQTKPRVSKRHGRDVTARSAPNSRRQPA